MTTIAAPPVRPCIGAHATFDIVLFRPAGTTREAAHKARVAAASMCGRCPDRCAQPVQWPAKLRGPASEPKSATPKPPKPKAVKEPKPKAPRPPWKRPDTCGTPAGHIRHTRRHEPVCDACQTARIAAIDHGTANGYMRHRRYNDAPCPACREAARVAAIARHRVIAEKRAPCGTQAGHARHIRYREVPCGLCTHAHQAAIPNKTRTTPVAA